MHFVLNALVQFGGVLVGSTRYSAIAATFGAVGAGLALWAGLPWSAGFLIGFCLPLGPVYFVLTQPSMMRRHLETLKRWHEAGLINKAEYALHRRLALRWYAEKRFGRPPQAGTRRGAGNGAVPEGSPPPPEPT